MRRILFVLCCISPFGADAQMLQGIVANVSPGGATVTSILLIDTGSALLIDTGNKLLIQ